jgi:hypothetical protein
MIPDTDELPAFQPHEQTKGERRAYCRFRNGVSVRCRTEGGDLFRGRAVNLSLTGVAVLVISDRKPPQITAVHFRGRNRESVRVNAAAVRIRRTGRIWLIGCAFERRLSPSEFKRLM